MSRFINRNKRGSLDADFNPPSPRQQVSQAPQPLPRSSVTTGLRGQDSAARMTQDMGSSSREEPKVMTVTNKAMVDSYLSSFNSVGITSPRVEDYDESNEHEGDDEVFQNDVRADPFRPSNHSKGRAPPPPTSAPTHPGTVLARHKPPLQRLEDLPGLSIVTWEEFVETPSVLCGLFETDRNDFIHYNAEQVNVFFHDSRMEQPTLGAPSGDGLSWTIFIDSYNHLRSVRKWLTERVSIIVLQLIRPKGEGKAACLVAINPRNKSVGQELQDTFSQAVDAFLHQRNFSIELNLNGCVRVWSRNVLQMPCAVKGGRIVVTNADESVPCRQVDNVPFCILCFPVWAIQKLSYRFKRRSEYDDFFLYFKADDLVLCTKSPKLKQYAEKNNNNNKSSSNNHSSPNETMVTLSGQQKPRPWIKKNRQSVTAGTQTLETEDDNDRANLQIEEVEDIEDSHQAGSWLTKPMTKETGRGKDSSLSSANTSTEKLEPQLSNGFPSYRSVHTVPARPKERPQVGRDHQQQTAASPKAFLQETGPNSMTSTLPPAKDTKHPSLRDGTQVQPVTSASLQVLQSTDSGDYQHNHNLYSDYNDDEDMFLNTPRTPRTPRDDPRASGFAPLSTLPAVGSDDEHGNYRLLAETPSPRPDTPFHKRLVPQSLKSLRPSMMTDDVIVDESLGANNEDWSPRSPRDGPESRLQLKGGTADLPPEPAAKQRKKRISKMLRDITTAPSSSSSPQSSQVQSLADNDLNMREEEGGLYARDNQAFVNDESPPDTPFRHLKTIDKVKYTPIKGLKDKKAASNGQKAFPYTSELLDFVGENTKNKTSYSLVDQDAARGEGFDKKTKKKKKKSAVQKKAEDMLFAPRIRFGEDRQDRNCLSDNDIGDDDMGDMEPDSVMSDVEGVASPRLIPVKKTERTVSVQSIHSPRSPRSDADTDWEITDCELDDEERQQRRDGPKILPGAKGAQQLRSNSAHKTREAASGDARRRGGVQNDSRRRYIALNSLRRKANQLALQAELRRQKRPDSSSSSRLELLEV